MIFLSNTFTKRSISNQSGNINVSFVTRIDSYSGQSEFGFSGASDLWKFTCKSGQILDNEDRFIGHYQKNINFDLSARFSGNAYDLYLNNKPISRNTNIGQYDFNYLYINPTTSGNVNINVSGAKPEYYITTSGTESASGIITGYLVNNTPSRAIRIFDIEQSSSAFRVSGFETGNITSSGYFQLVNTNIGTTGLDSLSLTFKTNFGDFTSGFGAYKNISTGTGWFYFLPFANSLQLDSNETGNYYAQMGGILNQNYPYLNASLRYISGSGTVTSGVFASGSGSGFAIGTINGSGRIIGTGWSGDLSYSIPNNPIFNVTGGSCPITGGTGSVFLYATGVAIYNYAVSASGLYSGSTSHTDLATGTITGTLSGIGTGSVHFTGNVSGVPSTALNGAGAVTPTGTGVGVSGWYTGQVDRVQLISQSISGIYSGITTGYCIANVAEENIHWGLEFIYWRESNWIFC